MKKIEIKKLDKLWRDAIKERDTCCQICGKVEYLNAHHVIGRRNLNLRWDLNNGITLCSGCHTFKTQSAHQDPLWFMEWFQETYPDRYQHISDNRITITKKLYQDILETFTK